MERGVQAGELGGWRLRRVECVLALVWRREGWQGR